MQCMANLGGSRNFRDGLAGIYRFAISVSEKKWLILNGYTIQ